MVSSLGKIPRFAYVSRGIAAWLVVIGLASAPCWAGEPITVRLRDGRQIHGLVDHLTDAQQLWLRREDQGAEVASGFAWHDVTQVVHNGQTYTPAAFQAIAPELKSPGRKFVELWPPDAPRMDAEVVRETTTLSHLVGPVRALVIEAQLAQWDDDAQTDGLRVMVAPLDARGQLVAVDGQIHFTLVAQVEWTAGGHHGPLVPKFRELERVSRIVRREHFAQGPAVYDLPFSQVHPDFDLSLSAKALVHARLGVPGRGVFEASDANVLLREYSRFRDQLQYFTPRRYLPLESGGQGHR
jgi:hypothetical protein